MASKKRKKKKIKKAQYNQNKKTHHSSKACLWINLNLPFKEKKKTNNKDLTANSRLAKHNKFCWKSLLEKSLYLFVPME